MRARARLHPRRRMALLAVPLALLATGLAAPVGAAPTGGSAPAAVTAHPTDGQGRVTFRQTGAPYLNPALPVAKRVEDLMARRTLRIPCQKGTFADAHRSLGHSPVKDRG